MTRRSFLAAVPSPLLAQRPKLNVILLLADDQRADTVAALGNPHIRTPNLDALVKRGFVMRNAYCMGGNNGAVCTPSRNMLLSGRAYTRFGLLASGEDPNFPVAMRQAGYETYHHGKRGNSATEIQAKFDTCKYLNEHEARQSGAPGKVIVDEAIEFLANRRTDKPFFMYLAFEAPHDPRVPTQQDRDRYNKSGVPLPANFLPMHPFDNGDMTVRDELLAAWPRTEAEVGEHLREYYAVITGLDTQIGRLLDAVKARGLEDDTLIIFSSDQGLAVGSHGLMGKQSLYDHSMKSPLIFAGPGVKRGESQALVYLLDIFPTVLDAAGAASQPGLDGRSFLPVLQGKKTQGRDALYLGYKSVQRAVRDSRYKLIVYPQINKRQLFDLANDPHEKKDLSGDPALSGKREFLLAKLGQLQKEFGDSLPLQSAKPAPQAFMPPRGEALNEIRSKWRMPPVTQ